MYLSQYKLRIFYKSNKSNIVFDVLFCLFIKKQNFVNFEIDNLNIDNFNINLFKNSLLNIIIEIIDSFRQ